MTIYHCEINLATDAGKIGVHFSRLDKAPETIWIKLGGIPGSDPIPFIPTPFSGDSKYTKIVSWDDGRFISPNNPWNPKFDVDDDKKSVYVFDISDWNDGPNVTSLTLAVDGVVCLRGSSGGDHSNVRDWTDLHLGSNVQLSENGDREFYLTLYNAGAA
jgi:hypothetical protein